MPLQDGEWGDGPGVNRTFEDTFLWYKARFTRVWNYTGDNNPRVQDVRGRIVILQNFAADAQHGIPYGSAFDTQDNYNFDSVWYLWYKWDAIRNHLQKALDGPAEQLYMNFLSGSGLAFPYFVASGHINAATDADRAPTGLLDPPSSDMYRDGVAKSPRTEFPRLNPFLGISIIYFEGTNIMTRAWNGTGKRSRVGIVYADFPGAGLINKIIGYNEQAGLFCSPPLVMASRVGECQC